MNPPTPSLRTLRRSMVCAATLTTVVVAGRVGATPPSPDAAPVDSTAMQTAITADRLMTHLDAFQRIADANGGNRAEGTSGYDASVDYVVETLTDAGYEPQVQTLTAYRYSVADTSLTFDGVTLAMSDEVWPLEFSASDLVDGAPAVGVDVNLTSPKHATSACQFSDFEEFPAGAVAVVQRGACDFRTKVYNAQAAGASAVVVFNQGDGNDPERIDLFSGTLYRPGPSIPAVSVSFDVGRDLLDVDQVSVAVAAEVDSERVVNVIADTPAGDPDSIVVVGAHLDGVPTGPAINDNGSGSAALLEIATQIADVDVNHRVRFAFWGAEERGLIGSTQYVHDLIGEGLDRHLAYLNFDMIGSPNGGHFVYDGDGSAFGLDGPPGSAEIEAIFESHFGDGGVPFESTEFSGRSDYREFIAYDIPAGGLFSGAEQIKSAEQAERYGGEVGVAFDPCYHQACDDIDNVNLETLETLADAAAHATLTVAMNGLASADTGPTAPKSPSTVVPLP